MKPSTLLRRPGASNGPRGINSGSVLSGSFFGRVGWLVVKLRYAVVLLWAVAALAAFLYLPPLEGNTSGNLSDLVPESDPAVRALDPRVGSGAGSALSEPVEPPAILVYSNPAGFTRADLEEMRAGVRSLNGPRHPYRLERAVPLAIRNEEAPPR